MRMSVKTLFGLILGSYLLSGGCALSITPHSQNGGLGNGANGDGINVGVKDLNQHYESLIAITGIQPDSTITPYYTSISTRISQDGNSQGLSPAILVGMAGLTGMFCSKLVLLEAGEPSGERKAFGAVNFSGGTSAFTATEQNAVTTSLFQLFVQRNPTSEELTIMQSAYTQSLTQSPPSGMTSLEATLMVGCAAVGSSLAAIQP